MAAEMQDIIEELNKSLSNQEFDIYDISYAYHKNVLPDKFGPIKIVFEDRVGSDFDIYKTVLYFEAYNTYAAVNGYYTSHNGVDYYNPKFYEVKAVEKTITEYV